jgi:hypothetical protein
VSSKLNSYLISYSHMGVDPCHHGMARPLVADGGMASSKEDIE